MGLRPYQVDFVESVFEAVKSGIRKQLGVCPTGGGKTVVAAYVIKHVRSLTGKKVLFLVHRDELVYQGKDKIERHNPGVHVDIEKAQYVSDPAADVVVASVQTIGRSVKREDGKFEPCERLAKFNPSDFAMVMIDEGHHAIGSSYGNVLKHFRCYKPDPKYDGGDITLLLITATPDRADSLGMETICDEIVYPQPGKPYGLREMIEDGWLADPVAWQVNTAIDISAVKSAMGDFAVGALEKAVNTPERNKLIVKEYRDKAMGKRALAFGVDVSHARDIAEAFNRDGIRSAVIVGATPENDRKKIFQMFREGYYSVLAGCGVMTEGFDDPGVEVILMARPTKSGLLYRQIVGRGLRPFPAPEELAALRAAGKGAPYIKKNAIIIDFVDNAGRHRLVTLPTLFGLRGDFNLKGKSAVGAVKEMERVIEQKRLPISLAEVESLDRLKAIAERIDLFAKPSIPEIAQQHSRLAWLTAGANSYQLSLPDYVTVRIQENTLGKFEVHRSVKGVRTVVGTHGDLKAAFKAADALVPSDQAAALSATAAWRDAAPSEKQLQLYWKIAPRDIRKGMTQDQFFEFVCSRMTKGDVSMAISSQLSRRAA